MKRPITLSAVLAANLVLAGMAFAQAGGAGGGVGPGPGGALGRDPDQTTEVERGIGPDLKLVRFPHSLAPKATLKN